MKTLLNQIFAKIQKKNFYIIAPILCFLADFIFFIYFTQEFIPKNIDSLLLKSIQMQGMSLSQFDPIYFDELRKVMISTLQTVLALFLGFHFIIYLLALKKIKFGLMYIKGYAFTASILTIFELSILFIKEGRVNFYSLAALIIYSFISIGYRFYKTEE